MPLHRVGLVEWAKTPDHDEPCEALLGQLQCQQPSVRSGRVHFRHVEGDARRGLSLADLLPYRPLGGRLLSSKEATRGGRLQILRRRH